jgi:hypothetical protein
MRENYKSGSVGPERNPGVTRLHFWIGDGLLDQPPDLARRRSLIDGTIERIAPPVRAPERPAGIKIVVAWILRRLTESG